MDTELGNSFMSVRYKFVFVGNVEVGKTSILKRFINNEFNGQHEVRLQYYFI